MVSGDRHERGNIDLHVAGLQAVVVAILHHLGIDAVGVLAADDGCIGNAVRRIFFYFLGPEQHVSIVYGAHEDILVFRFGLQGFLHVGILVVGVVVLVRIAMTHQQDDAVAVGQLGRIMLVQNVGYGLGVFVVGQQVGTFQYVDVREPLNHEILLDVCVHQGEVFLTWDDVEGLHGHAGVAGVADGLQPLVQLIALDARGSLYTVDAGAGGERHVDVHIGESSLEVADDVVVHRKGFVVGASEGAEQQGRVVPFGPGDLLLGWVQGTFFMVFVAARGKACAQDGCRDHCHPAG